MIHRLPHDTMDDCDVIIGLENDVHFCQWTFASTPGHPFLARVLELINERARVPDFPRTDLPDFVHFHTGPGVFTDAIIDVLFDEINDGRSTAAVEAVKRLSTDETTSARAHQLGACFLDATRTTATSSATSSAPSGWAPTPKHENTRAGPSPRSTSGAKRRLRRDPSNSARRSRFPDSPDPSTDSAVLSNTCDTRRHSTRTAQRQ